MVRSDGCLQIPVYIVDVFTKDAFAGSPAAICLLKSAAALDDETMQKIAVEMNQSVTAFACFPDTLSNDRFTADEISLRWFTPTMELGLCGHASLGITAVFYSIFGDSYQEIKFKTKSGILVACKKESGAFALDFPQTPYQPLDEATRVEFAPLLDECNNMFGSNTIVDVVHAPGCRNLLLRLKDDVDLNNLPVDPSRFHAAHKSATVRLNGVILTVKGSSQTGGADDTSSFDFVSRYFGPWIGVPEDHVCGSAHTTLAPYWTDVLGKEVRNARQVSQRGGNLVLEVRANGRMEIAGQCKIVMKGHITV